MINRYTPWPNSIVGEAEVLTPAVRALVYQTAVAHGVIGFLNASVLKATRKLPSSTIQESIARALMISLTIGDVLHLFGTFYGIGDVRWRMGDWPQALWLTVGVGTALFIPRYVRKTASPWNNYQSHHRICWLAGIGRFVATRDSRLDRKN